ncbi:MAG: YigZ family protein [Acutalibacteraceae bacterium]
MNSYKTVEKECFDEFVVKKSHFIGYVKPVKTVKQATDFIAEIKQKHWDATHNVYAYVLRDGQIKRYSDDGEPQGTAGMPVLNVLLQQELCDVAVVVTRYFGGILLGTGGLVHAYSTGARIAVESGNIITMSLCKIAKVCCDYNYYGKLVPIICKNGGVVINTDFAENVTVSFNIPCEAYDRLAYEITDSSGGRFKSEVFDEKFSKI